MVAAYAMFLSVWVIIIESFPVVTYTCLAAIFLDYITKLCICRNYSAPLSSGRQTNNRAEIEVRVASSVASMIIYLFLIREKKNEIVFSMGLDHGSKAWVADRLYYLY